MARYINEFDNPNIKNVNELLLILEPEGNNLGAFKIRFYYLWLLFKAIFKKGTLKLCVIPNGDDKFEVMFYREIKIK